MRVYQLSLPSYLSYKWGTPYNMKKKDLAKLSKEDLQLEKLKLEIRNNDTRGFVIKILTLAVPIATVIGTLIILWISNVFDVNNKLLKIRKHDLNVSIAQQMKDSLNLVKKNQKITKDNKNLKGENISLLDSIYEAKSEKKLLMKNFQNINSKLSDAKINLDKKRAAINSLQGIINDLIVQRDNVGRGLKEDVGYLKQDTATYQLIIKSLDQYISEMIELIELTNSKNNLHLNIDSIKAQQPSSMYKPSRMY